VNRENDLTISPSYQNNRLSRFISHRFYTASMLGEITRVE